MFTTRCRLSNYTGIPGVELVGYDHGVYGKATALTLLSFDEVDLVFVGNNVGDLYKVSYDNHTLEPVMYYSNTRLIVCYVQMTAIHRLIIISGPTKRTGLLYLSLFSSNSLTTTI